MSRCEIPFRLSSFVLGVVGIPASLKRTGYPKLTMIKRTNQSIILPPESKDFSILEIDGSNTEPGEDCWPKETDKSSSLLDGPAMEVLLDNLFATEA